MLRPDKSGLSMTVSGRSRERRSAGPLLSTVRLGQPRADVLTPRIAVFGYERSARQGGRLPLETARMLPWVIQGFTSTTPSRALRSLLRQADDKFTCLWLESLATEGKRGPALRERRPMPWRKTAERGEKSGLATHQSPHSLSWKGVFHSKSGDLPTQNRFLVRRRLGQNFGLLLWTRR